MIHKSIRSGRIWKRPRKLLCHLSRQCKTAGGGRANSCRIPSAGAELHTDGDGGKRRARSQQREISNSQAQEWLIPKDPRDEKSLFWKSAPGRAETRPRSLPETLFRMYRKYAETKGFKVDVVEATETGSGGYKEVVALIEGKGPTATSSSRLVSIGVSVFPSTEASGRIHTRRSPSPSCLRWTRSMCRSIPWICGSTPFVHPAPEARASIRPIRRCGLPIFRPVWW